MAPPSPITLEYLGAMPSYVLGSMSAASTTLALATSSHNIRVGHVVIVECGGEAGAGARATVGVGGTWPATSYADAATLIASGAPPATSDGSSPAAYAEDTGDVYYWDGDSWEQPLSNLYHWRKFWPQALVAVVDAVSGATLTLDTASTAATTNARVWVDCWRVLADAIHTAELTTQVPDAIYAVSAPITKFGSAMGTDAREGITLAGAAATSEICSPLGCTTLQLAFADDNDVTISDLVLRTSVGEQSGLNGDEGYDSSVFIVRPVYVEDGDNVTIDGVRVIGCEWAAVELANCTNSVIQNCYAENTTPRHYYTGVWNFVMSNSTDCHIYDCESDGDYIHIATEMWKCTDCTNERFTTRNGQVSSNGNVDTFYDDLSITYEADSAIPAASDPNFTSNQSIAWTNNSSNASASGGGIRGLTWRQTGDLGEGHSWDMVVSRSENLPANAAITFEDFDVVTDGRVAKSIVALDGGAISTPALNLNRVTVDARIDLKNGSVSNTTAPELHYDADTTTLGSGNNIPTIVDDL